MQDKEQYLHLAMEGGRASAWEWDLRTNQISGNKYFYGMLGLSPESQNLSAEAFFNPIHPEDRGRVNQYIQEVLKKGGEFEDEFRIIRMDGQVRWLSSRGKVLQDKGGKPIRAIGLNFDITEQKNAEEVLRAQDRRLWNILNTIPDRVYIVNSDGDIEYANPAMEAEWGPWKGKKCYAYLRNGSQPCFQCRFDQIRAGHTLRAEWTNEKNGRTYDCIDTPLHSPDGSVSKLKIMRDITERKQREDLLRQEQRETELANRILSVFVEETGSKLYDKVLELLLEEMQSRYGVFGYVDEQGTLVCPTMSRIFDECEMTHKCIRYPRDQWKGLWSLALLEQRVLYTNEPPHIPDGHVPIDNNLAAPILFQGQVIGLFNLANKPGGYTEQDGRFLEAISGRIAPILYAWIQKQLRDQEREQAQEALSESEQRYRALFDNMTEGFALHEICTDEQGLPCDYRFLDVNPVFERLTGLQREQLLGRRILEVMPQTERSWIDRYGQIALTGEPAHFENYSAMLGRWYEVFAYRPAPRQFAVVFTDVTRRRQTEEALRQSEARLKLAQASAGAGVWDWDIASGTLEWSEELFTLFGLDSRKKHADFDVWKGVIHSEDRELAQQRIETAIKERTPLDSAYRVIDSSGQVRWIRALGNTIYDKDGRPLRMSGICLDITRQKLTEEALQQRGEDLARAQEVGNVGSWRLDIRKNELTWSDQNHRMFGIPKGTPMTYETFLLRVHPEDREHVDTHWKTALTGEPYDIEHRIVVDDQIRWIREKAYLEFDKDGSLIGGFGISQDITDRKKAEEEIKNLALFPSENPYPILRISSDGVIMHSNPPGRVLLKKWNLTVHQKAPAQWRALCNKALHSRQTVATEVEQEGRTISLAMVPVAESGYVNLYGRDITVEKQAQKALQESHANLEKQVEKRTMELAQTVAALQNEVQIRTLAEEQLRERSRTLDAFFMYSITPLVILDQDFNFIRVNKAYAESCERDISDFAGHNHFTLFPHEENQRIFEEVVKTKTAYQATARPFSYPDHPEWGTTYWDWSLIPILDEQEAVGFLVFALEDVTEATTSAMALAESEQRFRLLAESIEDVFWMSTPGIGKMVYVSPAYEKIWGRSRESLYESPRSFIEAVHPKDKVRLIRGLQKHARGLWDFEYRIVRPDGAVRWVRDRGFPIRNEQGQLVLMCGVVTDITVRKQAEEKLRANQRALRSLTAELSVLEERERRAIAVDLHDSVGQILAFAARELEMLRRTLDSKACQSLDEVRAYLDQAIRETRTLSFDLSPSVLYDLGLEAALEDLVEQVFKDKGIRCTWNRNGQPVPLDEPIRALLYRSVRELLINIVKHAQAEHVEISLECIDDHIHIIVQDDGRGFDIVDLSWRGAKPQGFGLLSIRERLRHLGGRFQMQSARGNGTTITLIAPLSLTDANGGKNQ